MKVSTALDHKGEPTYTGVKRIVITNIVADRVELELFDEKGKAKRHYVALGGKAVIERE